MLDCSVMMMNTEIQRLNKLMGLETPRYDRRVFTYQCRTKKWTPHYDRLDDFGSKANQRMGDYMAERICVCLSNNKST